MTDKEKYDIGMHLTLPFVTKFGAYSVVYREDALLLLGVDALRQLEADKIIGVGPSGFDGFYYWNVAAAFCKFNAAIPEQ